MIDDRINETEDQCAIIISDLNNISSANKLLEKFPNAEHIKIDNENLISISPAFSDYFLNVARAKATSTFSNSFYRSFLIS